MEFLNLEHMKMVKQQGWNENTMLALTIEYIENQQDDEAFLDFLRDHEDHDDCIVDIEADIEFVTQLLDECIGKIQERLGETTGDFAAAYFSGDGEEAEELQHAINMLLNYMGEQRRALKEE